MEESNALEILKTQTVDLELISSHAHFRVRVPRNDIILVKTPSVVIFMQCGNWTLLEEVLLFSCDTRDSVGSASAKPEIH